MKLPRHLFEKEAKSFFSDDFGLEIAKIHFYKISHLVHKGQKSFMRSL